MNDAQLPTVTLRALEPEDLEWIYELENLSDIWRVSSTNVPFSRYLLHEYLAKNTCDIYTDKQARLVVENSEGIAVGLIDIVRFEPSHRRAEVGLVILPRYRHQGYGVSALQSLHRYALQTLHLHQLYAIVPADNAASATLFQLSGYDVAATLTDWLFDGEKYNDAYLMQTFLRKK